MRAPAPGLVLTPRMEERTGTSLAEGDLLLLLGRTDTLELEFGVPQQDILRVRPGQNVRLRVDALPSAHVRGQSDLDRATAHRARRRRGVSGAGCRSQSRRAPQARHGGPRADTHRSRVHRHPDPAGARPLGPAHVVEDLVMRRNALGMVCLAAVACGGPAADGNDQRVAETSSGAMPASSLVTADTVTVELPLSHPGAALRGARCRDLCPLRRDRRVDHGGPGEHGSRPASCSARLESTDQTIALAQARERHADTIVRPSDSGRSRPPAWSPRPIRSGSSWISARRRSPSRRRSGTTISPGSSRRSAEW